MSFLPGERLLKQEDSSFPLNFIFNYETKSHQTTEFSSPRFWHQLVPQAEQLEDEDLPQVVGQGAA